ncbi:MAG: hypothetical protein Q7N50_09685 [Armatimonadota bacterium]|nr:hypothetical protein [Armatimonadota bacterium]
MSDRNVHTIWAEVVEKVKERTISPALWRALEKAQGIIIEDGFLVVGFAPIDYSLRGHLASSEHQNAIIAAVAEVAGQPLRLRLIEGLTIADWENAKKREAAAEAVREAASRKRSVELAAAKTWEGVMEQVSRKYANMPMRQLPQARARYLAEAVQIMSEAMDVLYPSNGQADDLAERSLARLIEKVATLVDLPGAIVADRLLRYRGELQ